MATVSAKVRNFGKHSCQLRHIAYTLGVCVWVLSGCAHTIIGLHTPTGIPAHWPSFPLALLTYNDNVVLAAEEWNAALGFVALAPEGSCATMPCVVVVHGDDGLESYEAAHTQLGVDVDGVIQFAAVRLGEAYVSHRRVIMHELGHVLTLAHDLDQDSVMYPADNDTPWEIQPEDIEYIRSQYAPN